MSIHKYTLVLLSLLTALIQSSGVSAREQRFSVYFQVGRADIDSAMSVNRAAIDSMRALAETLAADTSMAVKTVSYEGYASPEGPAALNRRLSRQRRSALEACVNHYFSVPDSLVSRSDLVYDPVVAEAFAGASPDERREMVRKFGQLRFASVRIEIESQQVLLPEPEPVCEMPEPVTDSVDVAADTVVTRNMAVESIVAKACRPLYIGLKTNMLYDAVLIPTLGAEVYVGRNFSIAGQWSYAWWSRNVRHRYWRFYGGDAGVRWWFGRLADAKPLTGHHIGVYGQIFTYDFENGGSGQMGAKFNYGGGIEYGFALPIGPRLNIDFSIGIGYIAGRYYKYKPIDGHYVWQSTHNRRWFGPTKAEVSLVWLIGCANRNVKGGAL